MRIRHRCPHEAGDRICLVQRLGPLEARLCDGPEPLREAGIGRGVVARSDALLKGAFGFLHPLERFPDHGRIHVRAGPGDLAGKRAVEHRAQRVPASVTAVARPAGVGQGEHPIEFRAPYQELALPGTQRLEPAARDPQPDRRGVHP